MAGFRPKSSGQQESSLEVNGNYIHQMSKKISDLTQVVHMLFVQNHEKDVLIEALKRGYDKEFCRVIETGKERIRQIGEEYQQKHSVENGHGREQDLAAAALQISQQEDKIISISNELREVKLEKEKLEEKVKALSDATLKSDAALDNARSEVEHWKKFSSNVQEKCKETENTLSETLRSIPNIKRECFEEMEKKFVAIIRDNLKTSNRLYRLVDEQKEKLLKLEEEKKSSVPSNDGENDVVGSDDESTEYKSYDPKLDQLIRENKWLRMELSNREGNFNKIFTRFQPVVVKTGAAKSQAAINDRTRRHDRRRHRTPAPMAPETLPADDAELDGVAAHQFRSLRLPPVSKKDATISSHALRRAPTSPHFNGKHVTGSMNLLYQNR